jgi:flavin reductase (DIM6/NTAB) family NADH-FMN oxidoreductase RutF
VAAPTTDFLAAMGQHVSSVCVITTAYEGQRFGLTATAMSSVCAEPPRLLICVNKAGVSHEKIAAARHFCVNVLSENQDHVAKAFAGMMGRDFDKFSVGEWQLLMTGSPVLQGASAIFDCELKQVIDQFSHSILIGEVVAATSIKKDTLLYGARKFRNLRKNISETTGSSSEPLHF